MAGRKKSKGRKSSRRKTAKQSYAGLTKKQLIARLRAASAGRKAKKGRRKKKGGAFTRIPSGYLAGVSAANRRHAERAARAAGTYEDSESSKWNDLGRRGKKRGGKKGRKRPLSAWQKYIKANKNRRGMRKKNGMLNLRALAAGYRKSPAGRKAKSAKRGTTKKRGGKKRGAKKRSSRRDYGWY